MKLHACHICGTENTADNQYCPGCNLKIPFISTAGQRHLRYYVEDIWAGMFGVIDSDSIYTVTLPGMVIGHAMLPVTALIISFIYNLRPQIIYRINRENLDKLKEKLGSERVKDLQDCVYPDIIFEYAEINRGIKESNFYLIIINRLRKEIGEEKVKDLENLLHIAGPGEFYTDELKEEKKALTINKVKENVGEENFKKLTEYLDSIKWKDTFTYSELFDSYFISLNLSKEEIDIISDYTGEVDNIMRDVSLKIYKKPASTADNKCKDELLYEKHWEAIPKNCHNRLRELLFNIGPLNLPDLGNGIYEVEMSDPFSKKSINFRLSDIAIACITTDKSFICIAYDKHTSEFLNDVEFFLSIGDIKKKLRADKNGIVKINREDLENSPGHVIILACRNDAEAELLVSNYRDKHKDKSFKGYIYTDRPVYRPGQTVNFKGILRILEGKNFDYESEKDIGVKIKDSKNQEIYNKTIKTDDYGCISDNMILKENCPTGTYYISVSHPDNYIETIDFRVSEFRKPEFYINIKPDKAFYTPGAQINITVAGSYYFGKPVANSKIYYEVTGGHFLNKAHTGTLKGDANGEASFSWSVPEKMYSKEDRYKVNIKLTDDHGRESECHRYINLYYYPFKLILNIDKLPCEIDKTVNTYYIKTGETLPVKVMAEDHGGKPVETGVMVSIINNLKEKVEEEILKTDKDGLACYEYIIKEPGTYTVKAVSLRSRYIKTELPVYCYSGESYDSNIKIITDKNYAEQGETLKVLIIFPRSSRGIALVTIEGEDILYYVIDLAETTVFEFSVPVSESHTEDLYIGVYIPFHEGINFLGKKLICIRKNNLLNISMETDKERYSPRDYAKFIIKTSDNKNIPASSQVTMGIIDESIYNISEEKRQSIYKFFLENFRCDNSSCYTDSAPNLICSTEPGKTDYYNLTVELFNSFLKWTHIDYGYGQYISYDPTECEYSDCAETKACQEVSEKPLKKPEFIRENFLDTAYFNPNIITDHKGIAEVIIPMPDNLTTWRATALAVTRDTKVGEDIKKITVSKRLLARIITPRFFRERDEIAITGVIHNYLDREKTVYGKLEIEGGLELLDKPEYKVNIPSDETAHVIWNIKAKTAGSFSIKLTALTDEESDGIKITIPVLPHGCEKTVSISNFTCGECYEEFIIPGETSPSSCQCLIILNPSNASSILSSIEYLVGFPYGCVEQTMSRFLPNVIVSQTFRDMPFNISGDIVTHAMEELKKQEVDKEKPGNEFDGSDIVLLEVGHNLVSLFFLTDVPGIEKRISLIRRRLALEKGIILPPVRIKENRKLRSNSYRIKIKDIEVAEGIIIPEKFLATGVCDEEKIRPFKGPRCFTPCSIMPAVWITEDQIEKAKEGGFIIFEPIDVLESHFTEVMASYKGEFIHAQRQDNFIQETGGLDTSLLKDLPEMVRAGLERLYKYHHHDGGWGWWEHDSSHPYMTAYVVYGLKLASEAGYEVDMDKINHAINWMNDYYEHEANLNTKAYMIFAAATAGILWEDRLQELYDKRDKLNNYGKAVLSLALRKSWKLIKESIKLAELIENSASTTELTAWWEGEPARYGWTDNTIETTAYCLKALLTIKEDSKIIPKAVNFLNRSKKGDHWNSTKDTAATLMALTQYLENSLETDINFTANVSLNDSKIESITFTPIDIPGKGRKIAIPFPGGLKKGINKIQFKTKGNGRLYYSIYLTSYAEEEAIKGSDAGFNIRKNYFICDRQEDYNAFEPVEKHPYFNVRLYDRIMVKLNITCDPAYEYIIIEDPKPAGCEILEKAGYTYRWGKDMAETGSEFQVRDDRVAFFFTGCKGDTCEIIYYMKVETMGTFHVMPARVYLMYNPEINGISDELIIKTPFSYTNKVKEMVKKF